MEKYLFRHYDNENTTYHQFKYQSRKYSKETLEKLSTLIENIPKDEKIILIGHSLGGLVGRNYLEQYKPDRNISLITLGSPHKKSLIGKIAHLMNPSIIGTSSEAGIVDNIQPWSGNYSLYCISGTLNIGPQLFLKNTRHEIGDGTVLLEESYVDNCTQRYTLNLTHTALIYSSQVYKLLIEIIKSIK